jgi:serine/threonine protein kinase
MERLTYSSHVVDLYGYCGNSIVTEFAPQDLSTALQPDHHGRDRRKRTGRASTLERDADNPNGRGELDIRNNTHPLTTMQRLDMALQAAEALKDLHENDVVHADLTSKQFLVLDRRPWNILLEADGNDERTHPSPILLKVNDFNRCRFVPRRSNSTTNEKCTIHIPSAPGKTCVFVCV